MTATVTNLPRAKVAKRAALPAVQNSVSIGLRRRVKRQRMAAVGTGTVAMVLTGLSLSHLAHGIHVVTGAGMVEGWAMGIGIDLGFMASEAAILMASTEAVRRKVEVYAKPTIIGTMLMSAALNAMAFGMQAPNWTFRQFAAALLGFAIPALIYALARISYVLATKGGEA